jgi:hypothetical protein
MKIIDSVRNALPVVAFGAIATTATLPLAMNALHEANDAGKRVRVGTVKLTCFDRDMRASSCEVATPTSLAASSK